MSHTPLVVWGAGAIGGSLGAHWVRNGHDVLFVDTDPEHVRAIREKGLIVTGPIASFLVRADACFPHEVKGNLRQVMLCVKAQCTADAAPLHARRCLLETGRVASLMCSLFMQVSIVCNRLLIHQEYGS